MTSIFARSNPNSVTGMNSWTEPTYTALPLDHFKGFLARLTPHQDTPLRSEINVTHARLFEALRL